MGIDVHTIKFLHRISQRSPLGNVLTLGRQTIHVKEKLTKKLLNSGVEYKKGEFAENLFKDFFGASSVESIDFSDYEGATHLHDMNHPVPDHLKGLYDTVFDGGTLEHVFNVPQALRNISELCSLGGQIIHILPANNYCGHGFWQFSPELFFSLYTTENGYSDTEVFLADVFDPTELFKVKAPYGGNRVNIMSDVKLYVMVRTTLHRKDFSQNKVQQSDYVHHWGYSDKGSNDVAAKASKKNENSINPLRLWLYNIRRMPWRMMQRPTDRLDVHNPWLEIIDLE